MQDPDLPFHIYGSVALPHAEQAAEILRAAGWRIRKAGPQTWEARAEDCEIIMEGASPVLVHGPATDANAIGRKLADAFRHAAVSYSFELYDADQKLIGVLSDETAN